MAGVVQPPRLSGQVPAHHELDRKGVARGRDRHVGIGHTANMIRDDVGGSVEEVGRRSIQNLSFEGDRLLQDVIERRDSIRGDEHQIAISSIRIPNFSLVPLTQIIEVGNVERMIEKSVDAICVHRHGKMRQAEGDVRRDR